MLTMQSKRREHSPNTSRPEKRQGRRYQIGREKSYEARHSPSDNESSKSNSKRWAREHSRGKQRSSAYSQTNPQKIFQDQGWAFSKPLWVCFVSVLPKNILRPADWSAHTKSWEVDRNRKQGRSVLYMISIVLYVPRLVCSLYYYH